MATYASVDDLAEYLSGDPTAQRWLRRLDDGEALLEQGERAVDLALGPKEYGTRNATTGLLLDPGVLTAAQRGALSRAVCAWCEWALLVGAEFISGDSVETPVSVAIAQPPAKAPPRMLGELAGFGLVRRSATVLPPPPPVIDEYAPCDLPDL